MTDERARLLGRDASDLSARVSALRDGVRTGTVGDLDVRLRLLLGDRAALELYAHPAPSSGACGEVWLADLLGNDPGQRRRGCRRRAGHPGPHRSQVLRLSLDPLGPAGGSVIGEGSGGTWRTTLPRLARWATLPEVPDEWGARIGIAAARELVRILHQRPVLEDGPARTWYRPGYLDDSGAVTKQPSQVLNGARVVERLAEEVRAGIGPDDWSARESEWSARYEGLRLPGWVTGLFGVKRTPTPFGVRPTGLWSALDSVEAALWRRSRLRYDASVALVVDRIRRDVVEWRDACVGLGGGGGGGRS